MGHSSLLERLEFLLIAHDLIPFFRSDGVFHRPDKLFQPLPLRLQSGQVTFQGSQTVKGCLLYTSVRPVHAHRPL